MECAAFFAHCLSVYCRFRIFLGPSHGAESMGQPCRECLGGARGARGTGGMTLQGLN